MNRSGELEDEFIARIKKHEGILHKICFVYTKSETDKEDLMQEIVFQLWKSYPSFEGRSEFSTWMYRVGLNTAVTYFKKQSWIRKDESHIAPSYDPRAAMDYSEDVRILHQAIAHLDRIEKAIILLWLEEKSYNEIAETLGITSKNVSVKLVRIKSKLAEIIQKLQ